MPDTDLDAPGGEMTMPDEPVPHVIDDDEYVPRATSFTLTLTRQQMGDIWEALQTAEKEERRKEMIALVSLKSGEAACYRGRAARYAALMAESERVYNLRPGKDTNG